MSDQPIFHRNFNEPIVRFMNRDVTRLIDSMTVAEALANLQTCTLAEKIVYFYVTTADGVLQGVVPTRRLLMAPQSEMISNLMVPNVVSLPETLTVLEACEAFLKHKFLAFPVVDHEGLLQGTVDVNLFTTEMADVAGRQAAENAFQLIGVHVAVGRQGPIWGNFTDRFPWLLANIGGGILCAFISGMYEELLDAVIVLAMFIPVTLAVAESVSIQSATLTLQSMGSSPPDRKTFLRALFREFQVATLLGLGCGTLVGLVAAIWKGPPIVGVGIAISITLAIITACLLGVILPTAVRTLGRDPKIAAGPVVLASADIATLLFYFNLTGWMLARFS